MASVSNQELQNKQHINHGDDNRKRRKGQINRQILLQVYVKGGIAQW